MNTMKYLIAIAVALFVFAPALGVAQERSGPRGDRGEGMEMGQHINPRHLMRAADDLDLSDAQREQLRGLLEGQRERMQSVRSELREESKSLREMMADDSSQRRAVMAQLDRVLELEGQVKRQRAELMLDVREVLTAEQRAQARELFEDRRGERRQQMQERRQQRNDGDGERPRRMRRR